MEFARGMYNAFAGSFILNGLIGLWLFRFPGLRDWAHRARANEICWGLIILGVIMIVVLVIADRRNRPKA